MTRYVYRFGGNVSLDYRGTDHDLYLRGQYNRFERISTNDWTDYRSRPSLRLVQVNDEDRSLSSPEKMIIGRDPVLGAIYGYTPGQIVDAKTDNTPIGATADGAEASASSEQPS